MAKVSIFYPFLNFEFSTTIPYILLVTKRTCSSPSWKLKFLRSNKEIRITWLLEINFTPSNKSIDMFKMRNSCKIMTTTTDTIRMLSASTLSERRLRTSDSSSTRRIGQITSTKLKLDLWETKLAEESKNVSPSKEKFPLSQTKPMAWERMLITYNTSLLNSEKRKPRTKMRSIDLETPSGSRRESAKIMTPELKLLITICTRLKRRPTNFQS